ncbi:MAG: hypothetical protein ABGZ17_29950 [Planctomycetaceae bacterium]
MVRRLAFSQPAGPIADLRNLSSTTNSASSAASSKDSVNIGPGAEAAVPALLEILDNGDDKLRSLAVSSLGKIGPAQSRC